MNDEKTNEATWGQPSRRTILKGGALATGIGLAGANFLPSMLGSVTAQTATEVATTAESTVCVLTPEMTEGPYYVAGQLIRQDITEGKAGVPLRLKVAVQDLTSCTPLTSGAVEIWHCDAQGYYSGIAGAAPGGGNEPVGDENLETTFLRGVQVVDESGSVAFDTIYPGWYTGRTIHIHLKVLVDGEADPASEDPDAVATPVDGLTYQEGHACHTGQLFFDEATTELVLATEAYIRTSESGFTDNDTDNILGGHEDEPGFIVELSGSTDEGFDGYILLSVDPGATPSGGNGNDAPGQGGGGGAPPAPPSA